MFQIDQNVPVRSGRRIGDRLLNKLDSTGVHRFCLANVVICDTSRGLLNTTMYCEFKLMVRLFLFFENRFCTRYKTDVLQWWFFFVKRFVTRSSVSAMSSSSTTMLRLLASKEVGSASSRCKLGMSRFSYADCHSPQYHVTRPGEGSIIVEAFRSN